MNTVLVSVIVPVYNVEEYLEECVNSVLNQTYRHIELILIDDGSSDTSGQICDRYAIENPGIVVIHQKNGGLSAARNSGLAASTGKYIYFLDSDDYIKNDAIDHLVTTAEHYNADIVFFNAAVINETGIRQNDTRYQHNQSYAVPKIGSDRMLELFENKEFYTCVPMLFIGREALGSLKFRDGLIYEDVLFTFLLFLTAGITVHLPLELYQRRVRSNSIMTVTIKEKNVTSLIRILQELREISTDTLSQVQKDALNKQITILYETLIDYYLSLNVHDKRIISSEFKNALRSLENDGYANRRLYCILKHYAFCLFPKKTVSAAVSKIRARRERKYWRDYVSHLTLGEKNIFVIGTPTHGNLGDHLIALGEKSLLSGCLPDYTYIDIAMQAYIYGRKLLKKAVQASDLVAVSGGGWLGNLWIHNEITVRDIVRDFPINRIVILPQTVFYQNNLEGANALSVTKRIYHKHQNLYLCLRDQASYNFSLSQEILSDPSHCILAPDMALAYHADCQFSATRDKVLICFRRDREKLFSDEDVQSIREYLWSKGFDTADTTTVYLHGVSLSERKKAIEDKIFEYSSAKLIITDRLHSMIFAAIAGTPCIALDNLTGKVSGVYEWIKHLNYIQIALSRENVLNNVDELSTTLEKEQRFQFDTTTYSNVIDILRGKLNG